MRNLAIFSLIALAGLAAASSFADAEEPAKAATPAPAGTAVTYRVTVGRDHQSPAVAVDKNGLFIASGAVFAHCPTDGSRCAIGIGDASGEVWRSATIVHRDPAGVIALLRANSLLPQAADLTKPRAPKNREGVYAVSYDGNNVSVIPGTAVGNRRAQIPGMTDDARARTINTLLIDLHNAKCTVGSPLFSGEDGHLLGIALGTLEDDTTTAVFLPAATVKAYVAFHQNDDQPKPTKRKRR